MELIKPTFEEIFNKTSFSNETKTWREFCGPRLDNFLDDVEDTIANYEPGSVDYLINQITIELLMSNKDLIKENSIGYNELRKNLTNEKSYYEEMLIHKPIQLNTSNLTSDIEYHIDYIFMNALNNHSQWEQVQKEYDAFKFKNDLDVALTEPNINKNKIFKV